MEKYYIKMNGKVFNVTEETYKSFEKEMIEINCEPLCPTCKISNCNKIVYKNINNCPEINNGMCIISKEKRVSETGRERTVYIVTEFNVFDCKMYKKFKELLNNASSIVSEKRKLERLESIQNRLYEEKKDREEKSKNIKSKLEQTTRDSEYNKILEYIKTHEER